MEVVLVAIIGALGAACGSFFTFLTNRNSGQAARMSNMEARIIRLEARERVLWMYCQTLILHINQGNPPPAPPWPGELNDLNPPTD